LGGREKPPSANNPEKKESLGGEIGKIRRKGVILFMQEDARGKEKKGGVRVVKGGGYIL